MIARAVRGRIPGARPSTLLACAGLLVGVGVGSSPAVAEQPRSWTGSAFVLRQGDAEGIAVTSRGRLFLAPRLERLGGNNSSEREAHVWSAAADAAGNVYLGTGPDGRILKITPDGRQRVLFTVDEPMVTALAVLPGGDLLAGTAPEGKIYRVLAGGSGGVWSETGERYVWALAAAPGGTVFAATGEQGIIFKIDGNGTARPFFDSDEPHIVSLLLRPDGSLLAGGAGRGLVYELDSEGHAFVLHDDALPEARALALGRDGSLVVALLGPPEPEPRPPAVRIQLPDGTRLGPASESVGELEEPTGPTVEGVIEGLAQPPGKAEPAVRGRVVRISPDGEVTEIWRSRDEAPYGLALDESDRPVFGTGEPGRLYRADGDHEVALLASVSEAQVSAVLRSGDSIVAATSNPASAYRLESRPSEAGVFLSKPIDAGGLARWGTVRWEFDNHQAGNAEFYTRTGNSADPDATWSGWGPALSEAIGSPIVNPEGRFLQWRLRLGGPDAARIRIADVSVSYAPYNRPPEIRDFRLHEREHAISREGSFRWSVSDPDGDPLEVRVEYARDGSPDWAVAARESSEAPTDPAAWRNGESTWKTEGVEEGPYEVRAVCSDQAGNHPGEGREVRAQSVFHVVVDRTPPVLEVHRSADGKVRAEVTDAYSAVGRLEVVQGGRTLFQARPSDGVCDSPRETFEFELKDVDVSSPVTLRAVDAAGNVAEQALPGS